jgi:hypothetical protein
MNFCSVCNSGVAAMMLVAGISLAMAPMLEPSERSQNRLSSALTPCFQLIPAAVKRGCLFDPGSSDRIEKALKCFAVTVSGCALLQHLQMPDQKALTV